MLIFFTLMVPCSILNIRRRRYYLPMNVAKIIKPLMSERCSCNYHWKGVNTLEYCILGRDFKDCITNRDKCDVFCIQGVPAASMVYKIDEEKGVVVKAFYLNEGLLFLFDAGPYMRSELKKRYGEKIDTSVAKNIERFSQFGSEI